jgi:hypothetical protein
VSADEAWCGIEVRGAASPDELAAVLLALYGDGASGSDGSAACGPIAGWRDRRRAAVSATGTRKTRSRRGS